MKCHYGKEAGPACAGRSLLRQGEGLPPLHPHPTASPFDSLIARSWLLGLDGVPHGVTRFDLSSDIYKVISIFALSYRAFCLRVLIREKEKKGGEAH